MAGAGSSTGAGMLAQSRGRDGADLTTRVFCLRHGQSHDNAAHVYPSDPPGAGLTALGFAQAMQAVESLQNEPIAAVYSSTARRAFETAEVLAKAFEVPVLEESGLLEYQIGRFDYTNDQTAFARSYELLNKWLLDGKLDTRMAGGESGHEVLHRFGASMNRIASAHAGGTVAVVGHVGTFTLGLVSLCEDLAPERVWGRPLPHAVPFLVEFHGSAWRCATWPTAPTEAGENYHPGGANA